MKKFVLFLAIGLMFGATALKAQTKFGYVNSQELLSMMPDVSKADTALKVYAKSFQDQLDAMSKEYDKKVQDFQANEKTMTDAVKEVKYKEIQQLQERMQSTNESAQEKVANKRQELYKPLLEKADKAIKEVAKEKGYDYVFDASAGSLLYAKETDNILPLVKAKLGIK
ncbi:OmpH family outer membrane protein [Taibaiella soli]|uniref:OmpH family outer membrane protein n=1 Tax=Taibaiella soli TaxID=1649169 RepID=A0A2W2APF2_9BACT|nr:OmpH family outer membrane protein [Taibaiella soli]PZF74270.1 OmpH family outer membrane protein [Taibaiella soli]